MNYRTLFLVFGLLLSPTFAFGACSVANLTRCLDSACAINIGANPAARCQYCGSASAGKPSNVNGMKNITAGTSSKYTISDKELKKAPSDPGERYVWATKQCLNKLKDCTPDDVSDNYDSLIEKSCTAAGISAQMSRLADQAKIEKTQSSCSTEITSCLINDKRCMADYRNCEADADFDKFFADCGVQATGCDSHLSKIRATLIVARDGAIKNTDQILQTIVSAYQNARNQKLESNRKSCKDNSAKKKCIASVCSNNMRHKCDIGYEYEENLADQLCKFHDIACERLK